MTHYSHGELDNMALTILRVWLGRKGHSAMAIEVYWAELQHGAKRGDPDSRATLKAYRAKVKQAIERMGDTYDA